jgi:dual-specificity kinase
LTTIVDFGGLVREGHEDFTGIINTRQYRSPEVTLQSFEWNEKSDIWSLGCILMELYTGSLLFPTHDEVEHLAMIEKLCGSIP